MSTINQVVARSSWGGSVIASVNPVHLHECNYWRMGRRHRPCTCGALELFDEFVHAAGNRPWTYLAKQFKEESE